MSEVVLNPPPGRLGTMNAVVAGQACRYAIEHFPGPLSIKSVVRGAAWWETASGSFELVPGPLLVVNDGEPYSMWIDAPQPVETFCVFFARGFVEDAVRAAGSGSADLLDAGSPPPVAFFEPLRETPALLRAMRRARGRGEDAIVALAEQLAAVHCDVERRVARLPALRSVTRGELLRRVARATEFIHGNLAEPLGLEQIAAAAALSPFHFHRIFRAFHGATPHTYLTRLRLSRACALLRSSDRPVAALAADCGFSSATSFTTLFRRTFGVPPARFRKNGEVADGPAE